MLAGPSRRIGEGNGRWIISIPWPVIAGQRPEVSGFGLFPPWGQNRCGRFIHKELSGALQVGHQSLIDRGQLERRFTNPRRQGRAIQIDPLAAVDLRLPIERQVIRIF